jgi:hypothetical protein
VIRVVTFVDSNIPDYSIMGDIPEEVVDSGKRR